MLSELAGSQLAPPVSRQGNRDIARLFAYGVCLERQKRYSFIQREITARSLGSSVSHIYYSAFALHSSIFFDRRFGNLCL